MPNLRQNISLRRVRTPNSRNLSTPISVLLQNVLPCHQILNQISDLRPPLLRPSPIRGIRMFLHLRRRNKYHPGSLDGDYSSTLSGGFLQVTRLLEEERMMVFDEGHAFECEPDGAGSVSWGGDTTLEGVSERGGAGIEEFAAFFFEHLGYYVEGVDFGCCLVSVKVKGTLIKLERGHGYEVRTYLMTRRPSFFPLMSRLYRFLRYLTSFRSPSKVIPCSGVYTMQAPVYNPLHQKNSQS